MNWGKVKLIMIAVLLGACVLLGWNIWSISESRRYIDEDILLDLTAILESDSIYLEENAVPRERFRADVFVGPVREDYYQWVYHALCNAPVYRTYTTPDGLMIFTESGDRFHLGGYFSFAYYSAGYLTEVLPAYGTLGESKLNGKLEEELLASVRDFLKMDTLLPTETADRHQLVLSGVSMTEDRQGYYISVTLAIDGVQLPTNEAVLLLRGGEVRAMEGNWTFLAGNTTESAPIYDQVNILISEKKHIAHERLVGVIRGSVTICHVETCYCPYIDEENGLVYFVPGWKIEYEGGRTCIYDAVSNEIFALDEVVSPS